MRTLEVTEKYRTDSEEEAKEVMELFRSNASKEGYTLGSCGYTYKEKKSKGEVIDFAWVVTCKKIYGGVFDV